MPRDLKIPTAEDVVSEPTESQEMVKKNNQEVSGYETHLEIDRLDSDAIMREVRGEFVGRLVYEFCYNKNHSWADGTRPSDCNCRKTVKSLSVHGVDFGLNLAGGVKCDLEDVRIERITEDEEDFYDAMVRLTRTYRDKSGNRIDVSRIGHFKEPVFMHKRDGTKSVNKFAKTVAFRKAYRNAGLTLLPKEILLEVIYRHLEETDPTRALDFKNSQKQIPAQSAQQDEQSKSDEPAPAKKHTKQEMVEKCNTLFNQVFADDLNKTSNPAQYKRDMIKSITSFEADGKMVEGKDSFDKLTLNWLHTTYGKLKNLKENQGAPHPTQD